MALFRLFILDLQDNLVSGIELRAESDHEAMEWASFVLNPEHCGEVWCGGRCVGRVTQSKGAGNGMESTLRVSKGASGRGRSLAAA